MYKFLDKKHVRQSNIGIEETIKVRLGVSLFQSKYETKIKSILYIFSRSSYTNLTKSTRKGQENRWTKKRNIINYNRESPNIISIRLR